ncbi:Non-canonical poly(A) RNA polymerase [Nymphaea thermarum]|nr:Non-canonical poly(A) RNA polymerase [Nymphaea thermarum]
MSGNPHQLIDALSDHIALYHSSVPSRSSSSSSSSNPRNSILDWFASLTVHQRQAALTIVDLRWTRLLLEMQSRLLRSGHGFFIILPDVPVGDPPLPSLCYRRSRGLLARASVSSSSEEILARNVRLFSSREGEGAVGLCSEVDTVTVSEDFVRDLDGFVAVMDGVSNGEFLRTTTASSAGTEWEELPWLKAKGYYSVESFLANKMELALRFSWGNLRGKKRGVKVKSGSNAAGIVENVLSRKRGSIDWWNGLEGRIKKQVFHMVSKKAAKALVIDAVGRRSNGLKDTRGYYSMDAIEVRRHHTSPTWERTVRLLSGADPVFLDVASTSQLSSPLASIFSELFLLQEISASLLGWQHHEVEMEKIFFSSLSSIHTLADNVLRRIREFLLRLSSDFVKFELLEDDNVKPQIDKSTKKSDSGHAKGKRKGNRTKFSSQKKQSPLVDVTSEEHGCNHGKVQQAISMQACTTKSMIDARTLHTDETEATSTVQAETKRSGGFICKEVPIVRSKGGKTNSKSKKNKSKPKVSPGGISNAEDIMDRNLQSSESAATSSRTTSGQSWQIQNVASVVQPRIDDHPRDNSLNGQISLESGIWDASFTGNGTDVTLHVHDEFELNFAVRKIDEGSKCSGSSITNPCGESLCNCLFTSDLRDKSQAVLENQGAPDCKTKRIGSFSDRYNSDGSVLDRGDSSNNVSVSAAEQSDMLSCSKSDMRNNLDDMPVIHLPVLSSMHRNALERVASAKEAVFIQANNDENCHKENAGCTGSISHEWPSVSHFPSPSINSRYLPASTDGLHLEVGHNLKNNFPSCTTSMEYQQNNSIVEDSSKTVFSQSRAVSLDWPPAVRRNNGLNPPLACLDWPPAVRSNNGLNPPLTYNFDSVFIPRLQPSFHSGFATYGAQCNIAKDEDEKYFMEGMDYFESKSVDMADDLEGHWLSEEEYETHKISDRDYSQFFGGGVMYWNTSDITGTGFSRPPSLSSDDSSWARHEADLNRAIDEIVGLPSLSCSYGANGLASPPASPLYTSFDFLGSELQSVGFAMPVNEVSGMMHHSSSTIPEEEKVSGSSTSPTVGSGEGMPRDALPCPLLRPIIIPNISRRSMISLEHSSPCMPRSRKDYPRIKRPPSPVVLCVPRAPRPPPPSPVGESRKQRGFPTVRSGSSSPRHWGMKNLYPDERYFEEGNICVNGAEVFWPSCAGKSLTSTTLMQPVPDSLLQDRLLSISQLSMDQEHPDVTFPLQSVELQNSPELKTSLALMQGFLHEEIDFFCKKVGAYCFSLDFPFITYSALVNNFGRLDMQPRKWLDVISMTIQHASRYLANQEWVKNDSLKTIENTAIPVIMLVAEVPEDLISRNGNTSVQESRGDGGQVSPDRGTPVGSEISNSENLASPTFVRIEPSHDIDMKSIRLDISFQSPTHTGLQTTELVRELTGQFPAAIPLALVLKQFLADRSLDHSYSGGLSSYCLVLLIIRFLQHQHHKSRPVNHNLGSLLMDFFYFFGNVFDPRQMRVSIRGSGLYMNRERGQSLDPLHIDDPLYPTNNVGRNCFRIHQCTKAFSDAYSTLQEELLHLPASDDPRTTPSLRLLPMIIPSIKSFLE